MLFVQLLRFANCASSKKTRALYLPPIIFGDHFKIAAQKFLCIFATLRSQSCFILIQLQLFIKSVLGVYQLLLVTYLAAVFWTTCSILINPVPAPPQTGSRYISLDMNNPFAIISLVFRSEWQQIFFRAFSLVERDFSKELSLSAMCSPHFKF